MSIPTPQELGLPPDHADWREHQFDTINWIGETRGPLIIQAPTGSGKTAVGAALGEYGQIRSLTHTLNLQQQYADYYFEPLYGMGHYPCEMIPGGMANDCLYPEAMHECPVRDDCVYMIRRKIVSESQRQSLSYAYFLVANWIHENPTDFLYCDEAHLIPGIVKDYCTIEYTPQQLQFLELPMYPRAKAKSGFARLRLALRWLEKILAEMKAEHRRLMDIPRQTRIRSTRIRTKLRKLTSDIGRLTRTIEYAEDHPKEFYVNWNDEYFKLIPLTARLYFKNIFTSNWTHKAILTSATIGNAETFAREIGLSFYHFRDVPSAFSAASMPVFTLSDSPRLSHSLKPAGWRKWAKTIHGAIDDLNPAWSGIIHVSSANQALSLANALARLGFEDRVYIPQGNGTAEKIANWQQRKKKVPNTLAIAYSFHMGLDAYDDEINIVGKVPFATLDEFGNALLRYDPGIYQYNAALLTEQASGRIRRGQPEHYEEPNQPMRKFVAIADGNYTRVADEFSNHFKRCITTL